MGSGRVKHRHTGAEGAAPQHSLAQDQAWRLHHRQGLAVNHEGRSASERPLPAVRCSIWPLNGREHTAAMPAFVKAVACFLVVTR
jgi:hypothetical protein